jgi:hypothetical protein
LFLFGEIKVFMNLLDISLLIFIAVIPAKAGISWIIHRDSGIPLRYSRNDKCGCFTTAGRTSSDLTLLIFIAVIPAKAGIS